MIQIGDTVLKNLIVNNKNVVLKANFKLPIGWIGYISNDIIRIPQNKCHVSPNFEDCDYTDKNCWTKRTVIDYLETQVKPQNDNYKFSESGVTKNMVSYYVIAEFKIDQIGWRGYILVNQCKKYIHIDKSKSHISPSFEDCEETNKTSWTKNSVLKYLHSVASEI
jgi:hypothetical protein